MGTLFPAVSRALRGGPSRIGTFDRYLSGNERLVKDYLGLALQEYQGSVLGTRVIRRFANETPDLFCSAGLSLIMETDPTPALQYMVSLLLKQADLLEIVSDPWRFNKGQAIRLFTQLMIFEPGLDISLAKWLRRRNGSRELDFNDQAAERALDILDISSNGRRIVQILSHLLDDPNPRISSKATLVIGRRMQNVDWAEKQILNQDDPRKRANAIEAIWGIDTEKAKRIMSHTARDRNNRVAGNSTFGLHVVGDIRSHAMAREMGNEGDPAFRGTAAWVMGQIGDPGFLGPLNQLIRDDCLAVKSASLMSLVKIRREQMSLKAAKPQIVTAEAMTVKQLEVVEELEQKIVEVPGFNLKLDGKRFSAPFGARR